MGYILKAVAVVLLASTVYAQESPQPMKRLMITAAVAASADVLRTNYDVRHGAIEANPLIPSTPAGNTIALVTSYAISLTLAHELHAHGHPKAARFLAGGIAADASVCVAHNFRLFRW